MLVFLFGLLVGLSLNHNSDDNSISVVTSLSGGNQKYPSNFDKNFHRVLQKGFPDSKRRVEFEESQRKFYNSALSKLDRTPTLTMQNKKKLLSPEEQDAINYFTSQVLYRSQQDFRTKPNMFDTRESFLFKMHNESNRNRFLKSLQESDSFDKSY
jgi:hypothetical protein